MSDRILKLEERFGGYSAEVEIIDDAGPLNTWKSIKVGAWGSASGTFTNLTSTGHAKGCGLDDCWSLNNFDFDAVNPGDTGYGVNNDVGGDFPAGEIKWTIIK